MFSEKLLNDSIVTFTFSHNGIMKFKYISNVYTQCTLQSIILQLLIIKNVKQILILFYDQLCCWFSMHSLSKQFLFPWSKRQSGRSSITLHSLIAYCLFYITHCISIAQASSYKSQASRRSISRVPSTSRIQLIYSGENITDMLFLIVW